LSHTAFKSHTPQGDAATYGWPANLSDQEILSNLVALNAQRAEEERTGQIRYLRPEYQTPRSSGFEPLNTRNTGFQPLNTSSSGFQPLSTRNTSFQPLAQQEDVLEIAASQAEPATKTKRKTLARETQIRLAWPSTLAEQAQPVPEHLRTQRSQLNSYESFRM
jgi:hypothetical protein